MEHVCKKNLIYLRLQVAAETQYPRRRRLWSRGKSWHRPHTRSSSTLFGKCDIRTNTARSRLLRTSYYQREYLVYTHSLFYLFISFFWWGEKIIFALNNFRSIIHFSLVKRYSFRVCVCVGAYVLYLFVIHWHMFIYVYLYVYACWSPYLRHVIHLTIWYTHLNHESLVIAISKHFL